MKGWTQTKGRRVNGLRVLTKLHSGRFDRDDVVDYAQNLSDQLLRKGKQGKVAFAIHYADIGWRGGRPTDLGDDVIVDDPSDSDINTGGHIDHILVYFLY